MCSISLASRKTDIKTALDFISLTRMATIKKTNDSKCEWGFRNDEPLFIVDGSVSWLSHCGNQRGAFKNARKSMALWSNYSTPQQPYKQSILLHTSEILAYWCLLTFSRFMTAGKGLATFLSNLWLVHCLCALFHNVSWAWERWIPYLGTFHDHIFSSLLSLCIKPHPLQTDKSWNTNLWL